jgi:hypothetical protein
MNMRLSEDSTRLPSECEVLVIGSGLAGAELAKECERGGLAGVVVIEAGSGEDLVHVNVVHGREAALRMWLEPERDPFFRRSWSSITPPHYDGLSGLRRRLGGRSLYWYGVTLPIEEWALEGGPWPEGVVRDLRRSGGGESLYRQVEDDLDAWKREGREGFAAEDAVAVTFEGASLRPTPRAIKRLSHDTQKWHAYSPLDRWRDPLTGEVREPPRHVRFFTGCEALAVVVRDGSARGATVRTAVGREMEISAERVVLAAGTLESSRLAIQALNANGALPKPRLSRLTDHIVQGAFVQFEDAAAERLLEVVPLGSFFAPYPDIRSNLFIEVSRTSPRSVLFDLQMTGEQLPSLGSYVACDPGEDACWPITVRTVTEPKDLEVVVGQQSVMDEVWGALALAVGCGPTRIEFGDYNDPANDNTLALPENLAAVTPGAPVAWSSCLGTEDHEGGTLPLGEVLDEYGEFQRVPNLFAAGPCVFPRSGAANPALTVLALARRLAARISSLEDIRGAA